MRTVITAGRLWDGTRLVDQPVIVVEEGRILSIGSRTATSIPSGARIVDYPGATLAPAYFDVHIHGSAGHDVMEATPEALGSIGRFLARHGVGSYLATTVTARIDVTLRSLSGIAKWIRDAPGEDGPVDHLRDQARIIGIHFEGPFLSHLRRGVHPPDLLLAPDIGVFDRMFEAAEGHVRLMTLAPELPGAIELAKHAISKGVRVSVGHSNATAPEARAAIAAGAVSATHTYNAMRPLDHRDPGILGTVLSTDSLYAELICDGVHTMPEVVRIWWRSKGAERAILITDAMSAAGMPDGMYRLGDMMVQVKDGKATAGDALAGSLLTLDRGLVNCIEFTGAPLDEALRLVTSNPAAMTGLGDRVDTLAAGHPANMVAVDAAGRLIASVRGGQPLGE
jgi:N-acetylglucosamine-6-phosphate deacetylase